MIGGHRIALRGGSQESLDRGGHSIDRGHRIALTGIYGNGPRQRPTYRWVRRGVLPPPLLGAPPPGGYIEYVQDV